MPRGRNADGTFIHPPAAGITTDPTGANIAGKGVPRQSDGKASRSGINLEKYEMICDAYWEHQTEQHVANKCAISRATARKYIHKGDPARGMPAIRPRWLKSMVQVQKKMDRTRATVTEEALDQCRNLRMTMNLALMPLFAKRGTDGKFHMPGPGEQADKPKDMEAFLIAWLKDPPAYVAAVDRLARLESFLFGGPDMRVDDMTAQAQRLDELIKASLVPYTDQQIQDMMTKGIRPDMPPAPKVVEDGET